MVKIENDFGDVLKGKSGDKVYQLHYGRQIRKQNHKETKEPSPLQLQVRNKFKLAIEWVKTLSSTQRIGLKRYYESSKLGYSPKYPVNWYNYAKKIYIKNPEFTLQDPNINKYKISHPGIKTIIEFDSLGNQVFKIDDLSVLEDGVIAESYNKVCETLTSRVRVVTLPGMYFDFNIGIVVPPAVGCYPATWFKT